MDLNQIDTLTNIVIYCAGGLGTIGFAMILAILRFSRNNVKSEMKIDQNTEDISILGKALVDHDRECKEFRKEVERRFDRGSEEFKKVHRSLGKIEGLLETKK